MCKRSIVCSTSDGNNGTTAISEVLIVVAIYCSFRCTGTEGDDGPAVDFDGSVGIEAVGLTAVGEQQAAIDLYAGAGVQRIVGCGDLNQAAVDDQVLFCLKPLGTERLILAHLIRLAGRGKRNHTIVDDYIGSRVVARRCGLCILIPVPACSEGLAYGCDGKGSPVDYRKAVCSAFFLHSIDLDAFAFLSVNRAVRFNGHRPVIQDERLINTDGIALCIFCRPEMHIAAQNSQGSINFQNMFLVCTCLK
ncbi:hypothetical protein SDC9_140802 [bioreactor metagenome]|uniref:Uncharacterized protein n=1 Tax=bioreactor metagenome TaxID=1076179 RepID=A0A645DZA8_9ZZZZ